jgi:hypothetical protein
MREQDARQNQRLRSFLGAKIFFDHKPSTFDCLIRNFSDTGAQIEIGSIWDIPETFRLYVDKFDKSFECRVKWKTHNKLGVSYV